MSTYPDLYFVWNDFEELIAVTPDLTKAEALAMRDRPKGRLGVEIRKNVYRSDLQEYREEQA